MKNNKYYKLNKKIHSLMLNHYKIEKKIIVKVDNIHIKRITFIKQQTNKSHRSFYKMNSLHFSTKQK